MKYKVALLCLLLVTIPLGVRAWDFGPGQYLPVDGIGPFTMDYLWPAGALWQRSQDTTYLILGRQVVELEVREDTVFVKDVFSGSDLPLLATLRDNSYCFGDLNGDSLLDLIVFERNEFVWYEAISPDTLEFKRHDVLRAAESLQPLKLPYVGGHAPSVQLVDCTGDGLPDLIVGVALGEHEYWPDYAVEPDRPGFVHGTWVGGESLGPVYLLENVGSLEEPVFAKPKYIRRSDDYSLLHFFDFASPIVMDWNGDGTMDLVVSTFDRLVVYPNLRKGEAGYVYVDPGVAIQFVDRNLSYERLTLIGSIGDRLVLSVGAGFFRVLKPGDDWKQATWDYLYQEKAPMSVGSFSIPAVGDLDQDGILDLVVGNEDGHLFFFKGRAKLVYAPFVMICTADGVPFTFQSAYGLQGPVEARWGYLNPVLVDFDGDGILDILLGNIEEYLLCLLMDLDADKTPYIRDQVVVRDPVEEIRVPWRTRPAVDDFTGDGVEDLVILNVQGRLELYEGRRDETGQLRFMYGQQALQTPLGGRGRASGRMKMSTIDWDQDGLMDLVLDIVGSLRVFRNTGRDGTQRFQLLTSILLDIPSAHYKMVEFLPNEEGGIDGVFSGTDMGRILWFPVVND